MTADLCREERRLQRIFRRARWIAIATPIALPLSCGADDPASSADPEGSTSDSATQLGGAGEVDAHPIAPLAASHAGVAPTENASCTPVGIVPNPPDVCGKYVRLPCGLPADFVPGAHCFLSLADCNKICPHYHFSCHAVNDSCKGGKIVADTGGGVDVDCSICAGSVGRVPAGLARARIPRAASALGDHFAVTAHLEAASVHAFRRLGDELAAHGAPARLQRAARRAQRDEVRHARLTGRLARRFGGAPAIPRVEPLATRPLDVVAVENAVEGCVRETFGALVASWQAANATDAEIARLMGKIARDETRHAALSWAVARWTWGRLDAGARERLADRCRGAVESLRRDASAAVDEELVARAGLPDAGQQRALVGALEEQLWKRLRT